MLDEVPEYKFLLIDMEKVRNADEGNALGMIGQVLIAMCWDLWL